MAAFTYFYKLRVDTQKFSKWEDLRDKWNEEAQAAAGAISAGVAQVWKDLAEPSVYAIINVEAADAIAAHGEILKLFSSLPLAVSGALIIEESRAVAPYERWAEYLASAS